MSTGSPTPGGSGAPWDFLVAIRQLLTIFQGATVGQQAAVVAMTSVVMICVGLGVNRSVALPAWAVVALTFLAFGCIVGISSVLLWIERPRVHENFRCQHVPIYPLANDAVQKSRESLIEIRDEALNRLRGFQLSLNDQEVRANLFMLAEIRGGAFDGLWKLVMHPKVEVEMNYPPEKNLQFQVGQGATGRAFRDGRMQLTRRQPNPSGSWELKFRMTPELEQSVEPRLRWILSFPLCLPNTNEAIGVLNIDGLSDAPNDDHLYQAASTVLDKVNDLARYLSLQPSTCLGIDQLGMISDA